MSLRVVIAGNSEPRRTGRAMPETRATLLHTAADPTADLCRIRREEHIAIALCNLCQNHRGFAVGNNHLNFLDYQIPLKARRTDSGIGKVDIIGYCTGDTICVCEVKAELSKDTPLAMLLEGLTYTAIIEANMHAIAQEIYGRYGYRVGAARPLLLLLAEVEYWVRYCNHAQINAWEHAFCTLLTKLKIGSVCAFCRLRCEVPPG